MHVGTNFKDPRKVSRWPTYQYLIKILFRRAFPEYNGSQLKNPDISGALYTLRIQYSYARTQCKDGARGVRVL